jgi:hypothetical protein
MQACSPGRIVYYDDAEQAWPSVAPLVYDTVWKFMRQYGVRSDNADDLLAEGRLAYMTAYRGWNPDKMKLSSWVREQVWYRLLEGNRSRWITRHEPTELKTDDLLSRRAFDLERWLEEISPDARLVAEKALELEQAKTNRCRRSMLIEWLSELGWAGRRIAESFREIAEALAS